MSEESPATTSAVEYAALGFYHKISYLRSDTWTRLHRLTSRLIERQAAAGDTAGLVEEAYEAMHTLEKIEDYTAFPSKEDFRLLWRLLSEKDYGGQRRRVKMSISWFLA